jgi:hypothetical protein
MVPAALLLLPPLPEDVPPCADAPEEPLVEFEEVPAVVLGVSGVASSLHAKSREPESPVRRSQRAFAWNMVPILYRGLGGGGPV